MIIERVGPRDMKLCRRVAQLHGAQIHHGLLPLLGVPFMAQMYAGIAGAPHSGIWAAVEGEQLLGFISGSADIAAMYRSLLLTHGLRLAIASGLSLFRLQVLSKLPTVLLYPFQKRDVPDRSAPEAELLSVAVADEAQGRGVGRQLIGTFETALRGWGVTRYRVLTNKAEEGSNAFYRATGFSPAGTRRHHALTLQAYEKVIEP